MNSKNFAFYGGLILLIMGITALIPFVSTPIPSYYPALSLNSGYGLFLGIFPVNILNKIAMILFGMAGLLATNPSDKIDSSVIFSRAVFFAMGLFAVLGLFPSTHTLFGYWPLYGMESVLHGIFAILGGYCGFAHHAKIHNHDYTKRQNNTVRRFYATH